jgi:hypothetical protein
VTRLNFADATARDIADIKDRARKWRAGHRPNMTEQVYKAVCEALDQGACPQAVYAALVDLAFVKTGPNRPVDPVALFRGTVRNQEARIMNWAMARVTEMQNRARVPADVDPDNGLG